MPKKNLSQVNHYIKHNRVNQAMTTLKKVLANPAAEQQEKNSAAYMLAYLHTVLAHQQRDKQDAFLGVDLRHVQQDHHVWAAEYLAQIEGSFDAATEQLPLICAQDLRLIKDVYQYQQLVHHHFIKELKLRVKTYWVGQVFNMIKASRHRRHA